MNLYSAVTYTLAAVIISMLIASYSLAYKLEPRKSSLAFAAFFFSVLVITVVTIIKLWSIVIYGRHVTIPVTFIRPTLLLLSSTFLLYTVWKKNK